MVRCPDMSFLSKTFSTKMTFNITPLLLYRVLSPISFCPSKGLSLDSLHEKEGSLCSCRESSPSIFFNFHNLFFFFFFEQKISKDPYSIMTPVAEKESMKKAIVHFMPCFTCVIMVVSTGQQEEPSAALWSYQPSKHNPV